MSAAMLGQSGITMLVKEIAKLSYKNCQYVRPCHRILITSQYSSISLHQPMKCLQSAQRLMSTLSKGEQKIYNVVMKGFPSASCIKVEDISGGCGAMYDVVIESVEFKGKKLVKQHEMVNKVLKSEIADMHGIRITTKATAS